MDRAQVRNAADPNQVRRAARRQQRLEALEHAAVKAVMSTEAGRLVMWSLLERCGIYASVWTPSAEIHYRAGKQDMGHEIQALILEVDEDLYDLMAREARARKRQDDRATDASHAARAGGSDGSEG